MWCAESDSFWFRIELHDRPLTRRGVLSTISPILILMGTWPLLHSSSQQIYKDNLDWESSVPEYLHPQWEKWRREIV